MWQDFQDQSALTVGKVCFIKRKKKQYLASIQVILTDYVLRLMTLKRTNINNFRKGI